MEEANAFAATRRLAYVETSAMSGGANVELGADGGRLCVAERVTDDGHPRSVSIGSPARRSRICSNRRGTHRCAAPTPRASLTAIATLVGYCLDAGRFTTTHVRPDDAEASLDAILNRNRLRPDAGECRAQVVRGRATTAWGGALSTMLCRRAADSPPLVAPCPAETCTIVLAVVFVVLLATIVIF